MNRKCWEEENTVVIGGDLIYVVQTTIFSFTDSSHTSHSKWHRTFKDTKITDVLLFALLKSFLFRLSPFAISKQLHNNEFPLCHSNTAVSSPSKCETGQCAELIAWNCILTIVELLR